MTIDFICEELAELFDSPCNYSPMDEKMFQDSYCESHCGKITDKKCWKQYFEKVWADRKTENSSEKPNYCEPQTDYKKWEAPPKVDLPTGEITTCVSVLASALKIEDEPQTCDTCRYDKEPWHRQVCDECTVGESNWKPKDEPQTEREGE